MESKERERERIGREVRPLLAEMLALAPESTPYITFDFPKTDAIDRMTDEMTTQLMAHACPGEVVQVQALIPAAGKIACRYRRRDVVPSKHDRIGFYSTGPAFALLDRL